MFSIELLSKPTPQPKIPACMRGCVGGKPTTEDGSGGWARGANESTRLSQPNEPTQPDRYALHSIVCRDASGLYRLGLLPTSGTVAKRGGRTSTVRHSALASGVLLKHGNMQAVAVMRLAVCMCQCHTESGWSRSAPINSARRRPRHSILIDCFGQEYAFGQECAQPSASPVRRRCRSYSAISQ